MIFILASYGVLANIKITETSTETQVIGTNYIFLLITVTADFNSYR